MEHLFDIAGIMVIGSTASWFLFKTFKKARAGCGSICSGCNNSCQTNIKHFKNKSHIEIKKIS